MGEPLGDGVGLPEGEGVIVGVAVGVAVGQRMGLQSWEQVWHSPGSQKPSLHTAGFADAGWGAMSNSAIAASSRSLVEFFMVFVFL